MMNTCSKTRRQRFLCLVFLIALKAAPALYAENPQEQIARAQELLDSGKAEESLQILDRLAKKKPPNGQVFLLRSTAHFMVGDSAAGGKDLDRALEIDPSIRQAWLNRAALDLSEKRYDRALEALRNAKKLDPAAPDNDLNIGAVLLLQGNLEAASSSFKVYLERDPSSPEAFYLVATNYAMAGFAGPAIQHLTRAIDLDEKARLRARTDPNFRDLETNPRYQQLLNADTYQPPAGSYRQAFDVDMPYDGANGLLLRAVLDALQFSGIPFDPRVEVTDVWALIWSEMRIKVTNSAQGSGQIQFSSPANRFTPSQWQSRIENLQREITVRLAARGR
jgi:tetratricopeptide (TPR) repeat protein